MTVKPGHIQRIERTREPEGPPKDYVDDDLCQNKGFLPLVESYVTDEDGRTKLTTAFHFISGKTNVNLEAWQGTRKRAYTRRQPVGGSS